MSSTNIDFEVESNDKDPKLKVDDHIRISKYMNIFAKGYTPNWSEENFVIKLKIKYYGHIIIEDLHSEKRIAREKLNRVQNWKSKNKRWKIVYEVERWW